MFNGIVHILCADFLKNIFADEQQVFEHVFSDSAPQLAAESGKDDIERGNHGRREGKPQEITRELMDFLIQLVKTRRTPEQARLS